MAFNSEGYKRAIESEFTIVDKNKEEVPFFLNRAQTDFLRRMASHRMIVILKARKMGFSSLALALAVCKFIFGRNERCVSMSFDAAASGKQLERAKHFIRSFELKNNTKIPTKYNNKNEIVYTGKDEQTGQEFTNTLRVGTARSSSFGRGDDITFLHLTEVAFCPSMDDLLSGVLQAMVNDSPVIFETTANGYNPFKAFWDEAIIGNNGFAPLFYGPDWEYNQEFLDQKKTELGERLFRQEYPHNADEAFLTSGECFFDVMILSEMLKSTKKPMIFQFS